MKNLKFKDWPEDCDVDKFIADAQGHSTPQDIRTLAAEVRGKYKGQIPEDLVKHEVPDILALEARIQQLEEALESLRHAVVLCPDIIPGLTPARGLCMAQALKLEAKDAIEALSTPAPDVSPLWEMLAWSLRHLDLYEASEEETTPDLTNKRFWSAGQGLGIRCALTPELRALIEKMGGRE